MTLNVQRCLYDVVAAIAADLEVPRELVLAVILQESSGWPDAIGDGGHSIGLMQLHDQGAGSGMPADVRKNIYRNINQGVAYLYDNYNDTGDWDDALACYNMGYQGWLNAGQPRETAYTVAVNAYRDRILREGCERPIACDQLIWWS